MNSTDYRTHKERFFYNREVLREETLYEHECKESTKIVIFTDGAKWYERTRLIKETTFVTLEEKCVMKKVEVELEQTEYWNSIDRISRMYYQ